MREETSKKILAISFYKQSNGREPVREWLSKLEKTERRIIGEDIKMVQEGWPLGMPLVRNLKEGLWEIRSTLPNTIVRVLFVMHEKQMVLVHGFIKKTQETPQQDLDLARKRAKEVWRGEI